MPQTGSFETNYVADFLHNKVTLTHFCLMNFPPSNSAAQMGWIR